jgi:DNA-binding transcriptional LysR family regulator
MMPSPSDLTYFVEVATSQNISRAAERLGISQPSLTLAIQRLEQSVGTPLLIRSKKGVTLTQAGKQLQAYARELLQRWETVKGHALASAHETQGNFRIGCHPSVALYSLGGFLPDLLEKHPKLEVKLLHDLSRKIVESVIRMETDIGIAVNPVRHPDLLIRKLCDDEVTFWVGAGKRKVQDFRSGDAVLICDPELIQSQDLMKKLRKAGIQYGRLLPSSSLEVVTSLVAQGAGIGVIPGRVASQASCHGKRGLRRVPKAPVFYDEICLLYRVENRSIRAIQAISESILSSFATPSN